MSTRILVFAAATALAAGPLAAQQHRHGQEAGADGGQMMQMGMCMGQMAGGMMGQGMMGMMQMGMGMMGTGGPTPAAILGMAEELELTDNQVTSLEAIRDELARARAAHMEPAMEAHREAMERLRGDTPDLEAYETAVEGALAHMARAHVAMAKAAMDAKGVLTEAQVEKLQAGMRMMRGMMGSEGMGAMGGMSRP